jgi:hypothetical protein
MSLIPVQIGLMQNKLTRPLNYPAVEPELVRESTTRCRLIKQLKTCGAATDRNLRAWLDRMLGSKGREVQQTFLSASTTAIE